MADYQNYSVTRITNATMSVPRWRIELTVTNSQTGAVLYDFTGANALFFPAMLGQFSTERQDALVNGWVRDLIEEKIATL